MSTTRRDLLRLRTALLAVTATVFVGSLAAFTGVTSTAKDAAARSAPAVLEVMAARAALVRADSAAMTSFRTGQAKLVGPGAQYQNQIAIASQNLARVAEHNAAGESASRTLQLVEGLVVAYGRGIGDADASFRADGPTPLTVAALWYASGLMHGRESGIVAQLDELAVAQRTALETELSEGWMNPAGSLVWLVPIAVLLGLLVVAQFFGARRFRRKLNPALVVATLLVLLVAGATSSVFFSQDRADVAGETLDKVVSQSKTQTDADALNGKRELEKVLAPHCGECGESVSAFKAGLGGEASSGGDTVQREVANGAIQVDNELDSADRSGFLEYFIPLGTVAIAALVLVGLRRGIDEYRYGAT